MPLVLSETLAGLLVLAGATSTRVPGRRDDWSSGPRSGLSAQRLRSFERSSSSSFRWLVLASADRARGASGPPAARRGDGGRSTGAARALARLDGPRRRPRDDVGLGRGLQPPRSPRAARATAAPRPEVEADPAFAARMERIRAGVPPLARPARRPDRAPALSRPRADEELRVGARSTSTASGSATSRCRCCGRASTACGSSGTAHEDWYQPGRRGARGPDRRSTGCCSRSRCRRRCSRCGAAARPGRRRLPRRLHASCSERTTSRRGSACRCAASISRSSTLTVARDGRRLRRRRADQQERGEPERRRRRDCRRRSGTTALTASTSPATTTPAPRGDAAACRRHERVGTPQQKGDRAPRAGARARRPRAGAASRCTRSRRAASSGGSSGRRTHAPPCRSRIREAAARTPAPTLRARHRRGRSR